MDRRTRISFVNLVLGLAALVGAAPVAAVTNPTPQLKTGDYQAQWGTLSVGSPTAYSHTNVSANLYPTTVHYDAVSGTYVFTDGSTQYGFSKSEIVTAKSTPAYTFYRDTATGATLKLLNDSTTNPVIALTYVTYGKWSPTPQSPIILNDNYVVFGVRTPASAMPRSGSASYNFIIDGTYQLNGKGTGGTYSLGGKGQLLANFAGASLTFNVTPTATNTVNGSTIQFGTLSGAGFIDSSSSGFTATSRTRNADGSKTLFSANGNFYGPQANEIGAAFTLTKTLGTSTLGAGAGALVGKQ
jgi:hypothetical protein